MKLNKAQMHQRQIYETLVKDTILEPKHKIALPDRTATILRKDSATPAQTKDHLKGKIARLKALGAKAVDSIN